MGTHSLLTVFLQCPLVAVKDKISTMKVATMSLISMVCVLGIVLGIQAAGYGGGAANYGYGGGYGGGSGGGLGNGALLALIGFLFLITLLFSGVFNTTSSSPTVQVVQG